jgi:hypothetical protein
VGRNGVAEDAKRRGKSGVLMIVGRRGGAGENFESVRQVRGLVFEVY